MQSRISAWDLGKEGKQLSQSWHTITAMLLHNSTSYLFSTFNKVEYKTELTNIGHITKFWAGPDYQEQKVQDVYSCYHKEEDFHSLLTKKYVWEVIELTF